MTSELPGLPTTNIGLYYPYIHFRDEAWLKTAALYWDKMGRIVPADYKTADSPMVRQLSEELGFIENFEPGFETMTLASSFLAVVVKYEHELREKYGFLHKEGRLRRPQSSQWRDDVASCPSFPFRDKRYAKPGYVFMQKMDKLLVEVLVEAGLAYWIPGFDWVGMHPKIVRVYMTLLAQEMAVGNGLQPLTNMIHDHIAITGCTEETLTQALIKPLDLAQPRLSFDDIQSEVANIALNFVLPCDIAKVPVENIIRIRKLYAEDFASFQNAVSEISRDVSELLNLRDYSVIKAHLEVFLEKSLRPKIQRLEQAFKSENVTPSTSVMNVSITSLPGLENAELRHPSGLVHDDSTQSDAALGLLSTYRHVSAPQERNSIIPAIAYLLRIKEGITPQDVQAKIIQKTHKFSLIGNAS